MDTDMTDVILNTGFAILTLVGGGGSLIHAKFPQEGVTGSADVARVEIDRHHALVKMPGPSAEWRTVSYDELSDHLRKAGAVKDIHIHAAPDLCYQDFYSRLSTFAEAGPVGGSISLVDSPSATRERRSE